MREEGSSKQNSRKHTKIVISSKFEKEKGKIVKVEIRRMLNIRQQR